MIYFSETSISHLMQQSLHPVHSVSYTMRHMLWTYTVHYAPCSVGCTPCTVCHAQCTMCHVLCTMQHTLCTVQYASYTFHCALCGVHHVRHTQCNVYCALIFILKYDWLLPSPIPNSKFHPITLLQSRPNYHKSAKGSTLLCPKILRTPLIND